jgi:hypothetical protein
MASTFTTLYSSVPSSYSKQATATSSFSDTSDDDDEDKEQSIFGRFITSWQHGPSGSSSHYVSVYEAYGNVIQTACILLATDVAARGSNLPRVDSMMLCWKCAIRCIELGGRPEQVKLVTLYYSC